VVFALRSLVAEILHIDMLPVLVLDGMPFPLKDSTVDHRSSVRERALAQYRKAAENKDHASCERLAKIILSKIDPGHVYDVISFYESLRVSDVPVELVFAPFEADAQSVASANIVYTIDSDLVLFGAKTIVRPLGARNGFKIAVYFLEQLPLLSGMPPQASSVLSHEDGFMEGDDKDSDVEYDSQDDAEDEANVLDDLARDSISHARDQHASAALTGEDESPRSASSSARASNKTDHFPADATAPWLSLFSLQVYAVLVGCDYFRSGLLTVGPCAARFLLLQAHNARAQNSFSSPYETLFHVLEISPQYKKLSDTDRQAYRGTACDAF